MATQRISVPAEMEYNPATGAINFNVFDERVNTTSSVFPAMLPIQRNMMTLDLDIEVPDVSTNSFMTLPDIRPHKSDFNIVGAGIAIVIIGAGGTGGYVVRDLLRFLQSLKMKGDSRQFKVTLVDADQVEEKNLIRQNFITQDIGKSKATVLANRYGPAFGIQVDAVETMIKNRRELESIIQTAKMGIGSNNNNLIILGCVDNHAARRVIHEYARRNSRLYWIDSGNERRSGQVVCGYGAYPWHRNLKDVEEWMVSNTAYNMPNVVDMYPEISNTNLDLVGSDETSCAERAAVEDQNIFINMSAAVNLLNFTRQVIMSEPITINSIVFDIKGLTEVTHLTPQNLLKITK
jgi:PRTRC genetic system ThiF family protein